MHGRRVELRKGALILFAPDGHRVVTGFEGPRVPWASPPVGGPAGEHRHHHRPRVGGQQLPAAQHRVVEVRRHDDGGHPDILAG
jgi:hypothetical protein